MRTSIVLGAVLALAACNKVTYKNPSIQPSGRIVQETGRYFIYGLFGSTEIHADELCPEGIAGVQSRFAALDVILGAVTLGIYTPRTYEIRCGRGGAAQ